MHNTRLILFSILLMVIIIFGADMIRQDMNDVCRARVAVDLTTHGNSEYNLSVFLPQGTVTLVYNDYRLTPWGGADETVFLALKAENDVGYVLVGQTARSMVEYDAEHCLQIIDVAPDFPYIK